MEWGESSPESKVVQWMRWKGSRPEGKVVQWKPCLMIVRYLSDVHLGLYELIWWVWLIPERAWVGQSEDFVVS